MQDLTKAQITIGLLAFFATVWSPVRYIFNLSEISNSDIFLVIGNIFLLLVVMIILSFVLLAILEWLRIFDLKTNAVLTLITLVTIPILSVTL